MLSFLKCTLAYQQHSDHTPLLTTCEEALSQLSSSQYIAVNKSSEDSNIDTISITNLGRAVHKGIEIVVFTFHSVCISQCSHACTECLC